MRIINLRQHDNLIAFARWVIQESAFSGTEIDGGSVQDKAIELGLLKLTVYDPEQHGPNNVDAKLGDPWYVFSGPLKEQPREETDGDQKR